METKAYLGTGKYGIRQVPLTAETCPIRRNEVLDRTHQKRIYADEQRESVYIRIEDAERTVTKNRGKIVRSDFVAGDLHWSKKPIVLNKLLVRPINSSCFGLTTGTTRAKKL